MIQAPVPSVPIPPQYVPMQYTPLVFTPPAPPPLPEVTAPMPDVQRQYEQSKQNEELARREMERRTKPKKGGLFSSLVSAAEEIGGQLEKGINSVTQEIDRSIRSANFSAAQINFRNLLRFPPEETLWREYMCRAVNSKLWIPGNLYVSDHYLSFSGDKRLQNPQKTQWQNYRMAFVIPWKNIISIQLGVVLKGTDHNVAPQIQLNFNPNVVSDAVMIFTNDGSLHLFYQFFHFNHIYNVLDHAWRYGLKDMTPGPYPIPLDKLLPESKPIDRKDRPGLNQQKNLHTTTTTQTQQQQHPQNYPPQPSYIPPSQPSYIPPPQPYYQQGGFEPSPHLGGGIQSSPHLGGGVQSSSHLGGGVHSSPHLGGVPPTSPHLVGVPPSYFSADYVPPPQNYQQHPGYQPPQGNPQFYQPGFNAQSNVPNYTQK